MCNKIFRRTVFENVRLVENVIYEDTYIMHRIFDKAERIVFCNESFYFYRRNQEGISHNRIINPQFMDFVRACRDQYIFVKTKDAIIQDLALNKYMKAIILMATKLIYKDQIAEFKVAYQELVEHIRENQEAINESQLISISNKKKLKYLSLGLLSWKWCTFICGTYNKLSNHPRLQSYWKKVFHYCE